MQQPGRLGARLRGQRQLPLADQRAVLDGRPDGVFFDTITLKAVSGAFSLEGGGDGTVLPAVTDEHAERLHRRDRRRDDRLRRETRTEAATGDEPQVVVRRIDNVGGAGCASVPYSLANGPQFGQFLKPLATQPSAQFVWDLTWLMPQAAGTTDLPTQGRLRDA